MGKGQLFLPVLSPRHHICLVSLEGQGRLDTQLIMMDEVNVSEFSINKEVIEYMLILQEKIPWSI